VVMRLSLPSRLRGSGGFAPLFHTSIRLRLLKKACFASRLFSSA
jgi:hypothetical protein